MKDQSIHMKKRFIIPGSDGLMGIALDPDEISLVNQMFDKYPEKYEGADGILQALSDYRTDICKFEGNDKG